PRGCTPIVLEVDDDYLRSLAALSRYDVLLVNPVRDGLNLVAKEGPLINTRNGVLALSREAGAFDELRSGALEVNPFDVAGTAVVLARALDLETGERASRAAALERAILARRPEDWLADQLEAAR
ncbi:MAG: trehalose-6-phosphate synthase, partial [Acidimicrobiales bacterium]